jgi:hypothetical protein
MARKFAKNLEELEQTTYPRLRSERFKIAKLARRLEKKNKEGDEITWNIPPV